jgi:hypothetical protein
VRLIVLALIGAVVVASLLAAPSSGRARTVCGPKAARTVISTERLRIFRQRLDEIVCSRYSRRAWTLAPQADQEQCDYSSQGCEGRTHLAAAGRWVAQISQHLGGGSGSLGQLSLRAAGARRPARTYWLEEIGDAFATVRVDRHGAVAWVERSEATKVRGPIYRVRQSGICDPMTLDEGAVIDKDSLSIDAGQIRWSNGSESRTAPSCPIDSR